jgi:hypothetical protein
MKTSDYYKQNPDAYAKKKKYDKKYNSSDKATKKRTKLNKYNRSKGTYGNGDGLDACHKQYKSKVKIMFCKMRKNRGSKKDMPGDKRARG